ncbi:hypothetical protein ACMYR3_06160 [Ampullimonas aquatilis]|uniref:hypothetical protein n=1 Tax=Ampullimonas aquatilis TaxID=1341549 RepID=UPI003C714DE5
MPKMVRYKDTFYAGGVPKYESGKDYDVTDETKSHVAAGYAAIVNIKGGKVVDDKLVDDPIADPVDPARPELPLLEAVVEPAVELVLESTAETEALIDNAAADNKAN